MRARLLLLAPVVAGVALVGACSSDDGSAPSSTERNAYLTAIKAANVSFADDDAAVAAGEKACDELRSGTSVADVAKNVEGQDAAKGTVVVGAATGSFCRDMIGKQLPSMPKMSDLPSLPNLGG